MTYPATNLNEAVGLIVPDSNALHDIVNGGADDTIITPEGREVPTVLKAIADSLLFKAPIPWEDGTLEQDPLQLRTFTDGLIYWAPTAQSVNPVAMGVSPIGDSNWKISPIVKTHNSLTDRDKTGAHPASAITWDGGELPFPSSNLSDTISGLFNYVNMSQKQVLLSKIADIDLSSSADNAQKIQSAMQYCADQSMVLVVDVVAYVDCTRSLQVTPTRTRTGAILVPDHLRCVFAPKAEIRSLPNDSEGASVFMFTGRKDIKMYYPNVVGDRQQHLGVTGEWGHGYVLSGAVGDIYLHEPKASWCWGDGFYIGMDHSDPNSFNPDNITLFQPYTYKCSRNGISWTGGTNIKIIRPVNKFVDRIAPMSGIDIEPEHNTDTGMEISGVLESPVSEGCGTVGLLTFINKSVMDISITGTAVDVGSKVGWIHRVYLPWPATKGRLTINHFVSRNAKEVGASVENLASSDYIKLIVGTLDVYDCWQDATEESSREAVMFESRFGASNPNQDGAFGNVVVNSLNVFDSRTPLVTQFPLSLIRRQSASALMKNVVVNIGVNQTEKRYIYAGYNIDTSCSFTCLAEVSEATSQVLASELIIRVGSEPITFTLTHSFLTNAAGGKVVKIGNTPSLLTLRPPQDGTTLQFMDNTNKGSIQTDWGTASCEFRPTGRYAYGVSSSFGFS